MFCVPPHTRITSEREGLTNSREDRNRPGKSLLTDAKTGVGRRVLLSNMSSGNDFKMSG